MVVKMLDYAARPLQIFGRVSYSVYSKQVSARMEVPMPSDCAILEAGLIRRLLQIPTETGNQNTVRQQDSLLQVFELT